MKNLLLYFTFLLSISACEKTQPEEYVIPKMTSEFLDTESDTMIFEVYPRLSALPLDSEVWVKRFDTTYNPDSRAIAYGIYHKKAFPTDVEKWYALSPSKVLVSSRPKADYLSMYKVIRNLDSSLKYLYERSGIYTRYIFQDLVEVKAGAFYSGSALHSALLFDTHMNDSTVVKTSIEEFYGLDKGLVKVYHYERTFVNSTLVDDKRWTKVRIR